MKNKSRRSVARIRGFFDATTTDVFSSGYIYGTVACQPRQPSLKHSSVTFLHHQIEFWLELSIEVMLGHVSLARYLHPGVTAPTGF